MAARMYTFNIHIIYVAFFFLNLILGSALLKYIFKNSWVSFKHMYKIKYQNKKCEDHKC